MNQSRFESDPAANFCLLRGRSLHQPDQMPLGICEPGDDSAVWDGMRPESLLPALALDQFERGGHVRNRHIKHDMFPGFPHGSDAAAIPEPGLTSEYPSMAGVISQLKMLL